MKSLLGNNKFKFLLTGERFKDNEFEPTVTGVSIPGVTVGIIEQPNTIRQLFRPGNSLIYDDLRITFSLREDLSDWLTIYDWLIEMRDNNRENIKELFSDANLVLLTNKNNPNMVFNFENIFPTTLDPIDLELEDNDSPIMCSAMFKFINLKILRGV
jgi:hypothetical protein